MASTSTFFTGYFAFCVLCSGSLCLTTTELGLFEDNGVTYEFHDDNVILSSNGVPKKLQGLVFNDIESRSVSIEIPFQPSLIPVNPEVCLPTGMIGLTTTGIPIHNPYTADCCSAGLVEKEKLDGCWGKLNAKKHYYYDVPPLCTFKNVCNESHLIGVALDGFPIYGPFDEQGRPVDFESLDKCNGREDARRNYRYHINPTFPFMLGCFRGTPATPTTCGCSSLSPACDHRLDTKITELTCCADATDCDYITNDAYSAGESIYERITLTASLTILLQLITNFLDYLI